MNKTNDEIEKVLTDLYNKPCYLVQKGYGSFITMEFGNPKLKIHEFTIENKNLIKKYKKDFQRMVYVMGEWHLWIYMCSWEVYFKGKRIIHSESKKNIMEINFARYLNGQKLIDLNIDPENGNTEFIFDLGCVLKTKSYEDKDVQWKLFDKIENVLSIKGTGEYSYKSKYSNEDEDEWKKI